MSEKFETTVGGEDEMSSKLIRELPALSPNFHIRAQESIAHLWLKPNSTSTGEEHRGKQQDPEQK